ncbi:transporter substrate-binding domain-containing protein [Marinobacter sediminum]|nr:transporter substrate-binding domain-containing protein [Marinobacter sediminum]
MYSRLIKTLDTILYRRPGFLKLLTALIALVLLSNSVASAEKADPSKILRIAYVEFPPITYQNDAGKPDGTFIDMTRKVAEEAGYVPEFLYLPVSRAYLYLSNGLIDVWPGVTNIPSIKDDVLESWSSPSAIHLSAWYREGVTPVNHFDQLKGKTVIVIGGYTYAGLLSWLEAQDTITVTEAPNHRSALDMLKRKRGDYLLDYRQPVEEVLVMPSDSMIRYSKVRSRNLAWLFSLANPRAALLRDDFDDAYIRLVERGEAPPVRVMEEGFIIPGFPDAYR